MKIKITLMVLAIFMADLLHAQTPDPLRGAWYFAFKPSAGQLTTDLATLRAGPVPVDFKGVLAAISWSQIQPNAPDVFTWTDFDAIMEAIVGINNSNNLKIGLMIYAGNNAPIGYLITNSEVPVDPQNLPPDITVTSSNSQNWLKTYVSVYTTTFTDNSVKNDYLYTNGNTPYYKQDLWPDYLYKKSTVGKYLDYWKAMISKLIEHINTKSYKSSIAFIQSCEGSTGDQDPYKGTPFPLVGDNTSYVINDKEWKVGDGDLNSSYLGFMAKSWKYLYDQINTSNLTNVKLLVNTGLSPTLYGLNPPLTGTSEYNLNKDQVAGLAYPQTTSLFSWSSTYLNTTGKPFWRKANNMGHWFQQNFEEQFKTALNNLDTVNVLTRDELDFGGGTAISPGDKPENLFAIATSAIDGGLDMWMIKKQQIIDALGAVRLENKYIINFFSTYVKQKDALTDINAFCALREELDAHNRVGSCGSLSLDNGYLYTVGSGSAFNNTCYLDEIKGILLNTTSPTDLYDRGARLQSPVTGNANPEYELFGTPFKQSKAGMTYGAINDVGWYIHPGNYKKNLSEVAASLTGTIKTFGYWNKLSEDPDNIGTIQPYGLFCRGLSSNTANNDNIMYFKMNSPFYDNIKTTGTSVKTIEHIKIKITYFDDVRGGKFRIYYRKPDGTLTYEPVSLSLISSLEDSAWRSKEIPLDNVMLWDNNKYWDFYIKNMTSEAGNGNIRDLKFSIVEITEVTKTSSPLRAVNQPAEYAATRQPEVVSNSLQINPNPASAWFDVQLKNSETIQALTIYNAQGKQVWQKQVNENTYRVYTSYLGNAKGIFFVIVQTPTGSYKQAVTVL